MQLAKTLGFKVRMASSNHSLCYILIALVACIILFESNFISIEATSNDNQATESVSNDTVKEYWTKRLEVFKKNTTFDLSNVSF